MLRGSKPAEIARPGSNHVALRAVNERLVLSLIRAHGSLSKAQLAELSGLAAQTASVITRSLIEAGLLVAGSPVKGKVGQPYVPLSLDPAGASFLGVHVDKHEVRTAHVNFVGEVISETAAQLATDDLEQVVKHVYDQADRIRAQLDIDDRSRFQAIGVSVASGGLSGDRSARRWSEIENAFHQVGRSLNLSINVSSDAVAACSAELIYGIGPTVPDFLYVFLDSAVGGGLVQDRRIRFSRDDTGPDLGKLLIPNGKARPVQLKNLAIGDNGNANAIGQLAEGIACAIANCAALIPCQTVIVDGPLPAHMLRLVMAKLRSAIAQLDFVGNADIAAREGSMARKSIAMGAACLPLLDRYYPEA
ncbi:winged helix-turn-helix transcriptional regulator (plasmid) [Rhizobium sp. 32-5/1]|uniref:ROK family transcriptional regulator n=1 Tax=Rhizobium sp. 32-5/1 TaxID=3019602 RepID=UPI00240E4546|nr:winged helix-turn-helix transcriptional regulator [Rhizobium sp. 32-5/1]WEZ85437.1 winged helix-turn-helix transcriptional regulator [Rhizobium sp. 32-5/1]